MDPLTGDAGVPDWLVPGTLLIDGPAIFLDLRRPAQGKEVVVELHEAVICRE